MALVQYLQLDYDDIYLIPSRAFMIKLVASFYCLFLFSAAAKADETIIAITDGNLPPFAHVQQGELTGAYVDIVRLIFKEAKVDVDIKQYPFARAIQTVQDNHNMMYFPMGRTNDRLSQFLWVGPILEKGRMNLYRLKTRNDIKIDSMDDAKKYTVGVVQGYSSQQLLRNMGFIDKVNIRPVTSLEQNVKKLLAGRVDLIVAYADGNDELIEMYGMTKEGTVNVQFLDITTAAYLAFNKQLPTETFDAIKSAYLRLHNSSIFQDIATQHLENTMK